MSDVFRVRLVNIRHRQHNRAFEDDEESGLFHFRHDLLEQIPVYLAFADKMMKTDPGSYAIYSKVGGIMLPPTAMLGSTLADVDTRSIPSFSCAMLGSGLADEKEDPDRIWPRLLYLQKKKHIPGVQFSKGDLYSMTMFYTRTNDTRATPVRYHVTVGDAGEVRLMRELRSSSVRMRSKTGVHRTYDIPSKHWQVPSMLREIANEGKRDVEELAKTVFCFLAGVAPRMKSGVQVRAHRGGARAVFNVPIGRTPYFFKDRDIMTNEHGRTKKIFHYVAGFARSDGTTVRPHTKGLRDFEWNGYKIHIGIPGVDFPNINAFTHAGVHVDDDAPIQPGMVDAGEAAANIASVVESSQWWHQRKRVKRVAK